MPTEEQVTVQGPVKEQQPDRMSERGPPRGLGHNLLMRFSSLCGSKMEIPETAFFFNILTIHNDQISHVKRVLDPIYVLFTLFGCLDGGKGLGHNLPMQFSTLGRSKIEIFKPFLFVP